MQFIIIIFKIFTITEKKSTKINSSLANQKKQASNLKKNTNRYSPFSYSEIINKKQQNKLFIKPKNTRVLKQVKKTTLKIHLQYLKKKINY